MKNLKIWTTITILLLSLSRPTHATPCLGKSLLFSTVATGTMTSAVFLNLWSLERFLEYYELEDPTLRTITGSLAVVSTLYIMSATKLHALWTLSKKEPLSDQLESLLPNSEEFSVTLKPKEKCRNKILKTIGFFSRAFPAREVLSASTLLKNTNISTLHALPILTALLSLSEVSTYCAFNIPKSLHAYDWLFDHKFNEEQYIEDSSHNKKIAISLSLIPLCAGASAYLYAIESGITALFPNSEISQQPLKLITASILTAGLLTIDLPMKFRALYRYLGRKSSPVKLKPQYLFLHRILGLSFACLSFTVDYRSALHVLEKFHLADHSWDTAVPAAILSGINSLIVHEVLVRHVEDFILPQYPSVIKFPNPDWDILFP